MAGTQDQDRLRRLRDRQLAARDPLTKQRKMHGRIACKHRQSQAPLSIGRIWSEIPHLWKGAFYGLTVGALAVAILPAIWASPWALPCAGGLAAMLAILGLLLGRAADTRDALRDLTR